jgi:hypothetical protein
MPSGRILPSRGRLAIDALPAIDPGDAAFDNSKSLARHSRQRLLAVLDEPDLAESDGHAAIVSDPAVPGLQNDN